MTLRCTLMDTVDHPRIFQYLADTLPFGIYIVSIDGTIQYGNRKAEEITGSLSQEIVGRTCSRLLACCDPAGNQLCGSSECPIRRALRDRTSSQHRVTLNHKNGWRVPAVMRTVYLTDDNGNSYVVVCCFLEERPTDDELSWIEENEAEIDPALGIYSLQTTEKQLKSTACSPSAPFAVISIEVQALSEVVSKHGAEMLRMALRTVIHSLRRILTMPHYLGRWHNHGLLLLVPGCDASVSSELEKKLTVIANGCAVTWWGDRIAVPFAVRSAFWCSTHSCTTDVTALLSSGENSPTGDAHACL